MQMFTVAAITLIKLGFPSDMQYQQTHKILKAIIFIASHMKIK